MENILNQHLQKYLLLFCDCTVFHWAHVSWSNPFFNLSALRLLPLLLLMILHWFPLYRSLCLYLGKKQTAYFMLLLLSCSVVSDSLQPNGLQHARPSCPSPSPGVCQSSCPFHQWCHPAISSSDTLFSFCPQSFPASWTFPVSHLFTSDDQNTGASASASVLPVNIQGWSPLRSTGLIFLLSKGLSGVFSSTTVQRHQFFGVLPSLRSSSHNHMWPQGRPQPWLYGPLSAE